MGVLFHGCHVIIPPGYLTDRENRDTSMLLYRCVYTPTGSRSSNYRQLQVVMYTLAGAPGSTHEKQHLLKRIINSYLNRYYKNEVTVFNEGTMTMLPDGARLDLYSFEALSNEEEKAEHGIFATHVLSLLIHGDKVFLLAAHADSKDFRGFSGEFDSFFKSMIIKDKRIQALHGFTTWTTAVACKSGCSQQGIWRGLTGNGLSVKLISAHCPAYGTKK